MIRASEFIPIRKLLLAKIQSRVSPEGLSPAVVAAVARALMPVSSADTVGPRAVWRAWIETVECAVQEPSLIKEPAFRHAMARMIALSAVCIALDDPDVSGAVEIMLSLDPNPHVQGKP